MQLPGALVGYVSSRRFCVWINQAMPGRPGKTKIPYGAGGLQASASDPATWIGWDEATRVLEATKAAFLARGEKFEGGTGVFLGDGLIGIDLDSCLDGAGLAQWALDAITGLGSYCEISPSGFGCKTLMTLRAADVETVRGALGMRGERRAGRRWARKGKKGAHPPGIEIYLDRRFFAVTGDDLGLTPATLSAFEADRHVKVILDAASAVIGEDASSSGGGGATAGHDGPDIGIVAVGTVEARVSPWMLAQSGRLARLWAGDLSDLGADRSRSAIAFNMAHEMRRLGMEVEEVCSALAGHPLTGDWVNEKGLAGGGRELRRAIGAAVPLFEVLEEVPGASSADPRPERGTRSREKKDKKDSKKEPEKRVKNSVLRGELPDGSGRPNALDRVDIDKGEKDFPHLGRDPRGGFIIKLTPPLHLTVEAAEHAVLASGAAVFQRGQELVHPMLLDMRGLGGTKTTTAAFVPISTSYGSRLMSEAAIWVKWDTRVEGWVRCDPNDRTVNIWRESPGRWKAPTVRGIITVPTLREDGSIVSQPGLDDATRLYFMPDEKVQMPPRWDQALPVRKDAEDALALLDGLLDEFPFVDAVDRAVALSGMITPVVRGALGTRPLHAYNAHEAGSGKTFLVHVSTAIAMGRPAPMASVGKNEEETEKRLGALLLAGVPIGVLDNVNGTLEGSLLCQAVDQPLLSIRVLGLSEQREVENSISLYATGNNMTVKGDLVRRTLECRLDPLAERPETRSFARNPLAEIMADRGKYIAAVMTIVRAHALAGFPGTIGMRPLISFDDWSRYVRGALIWLGKADAAQSVDRVYRADPERNDLRDMLRLWMRRFGTGEGGARSLREAIDTFGVGTFRGVSWGGETALGPLTDTSQDVSPVISASDDGTAAQAATTFNEIIARIAGHGNQINMRVLGKWFARNIGRVMGGLRLARGGLDSHAKTQTWIVERITPHLMAVEEQQKSP